MDTGADWASAGAGGPTGGLGWAMRRVPRSSLGHRDGCQTKVPNTQETHKPGVPGL